jgi:hypothetical protein
VHVLLLGVCTLVCLCVQVMCSNVLLAWQHLMKSDNGIARCEELNGRWQQKPLVREAL